MNQRKRISTTICVFLSLFLVTSGSKIFTLFFTEFEKNGIPITVVSIASVVVTATIFVTGLYIGKVIARLGIRKTMILGCILMALSFVMFAISTIPSLFAGFLFLGGGTTFCGYTPASLIISNWYGKKKGLALSAVFTGMSLGASFYSYVAGILLTKWGLRGTGFCVSVFILVTGLPILFLAIREKPDVDPDAADELAAGTDVSAKSTQKDLLLLDVSPKTAGKTALFAVIMVVVLLSSGVVSTVQSYIPSHLQAEGLDTIGASRIYSLMMLVGTLGTLLGGFIADKKGTRTFILYTSVVFFIGTWLLIFCPQQMGLLYVAAVLMGLSYPLCSMTPTLLMADTFGKEAYSGLLGIVQASTFASIGVFFPLTGVLYRVNGSYKMAYVILNLLMIVSIIFTLIATSRKAKERELEKLRVHSL